jgi:hypothetical protein
LSLTAPGVAQVSVLMQHNDISRTGQNLNETVLNTSNVNVGGFGKLFWRTVDGLIYAQPLYVQNLNLQGKTRNVVYVATEHNSVYAFDADDPTQVAPLWQVNFGPTVPSQDICIITGDTNPGDCPYLDINPEIGITSTPAIDPAAGIIYVVAKTKRASDSTYHFNLHALSLTSGAEQLGGPVEITGQVPGSGAGSSGGTLAFNPTFHLQRPGLLLMNGVLYLGFGSVGDIGTFHGWIFAYNATTLQQEAILCTTPNGSDGGLWATGQGLVGDSSGNVYAMTGNGDFNANTSGKDYGDSFLKISTASGLSVADYFTPSNQASLFSGDVDLGSGGPVALPGTTLLVGIGKDKLFRVVDSTNMGHFNSGFDNDVQQFTVGTNSYFGSPVYWDSPNNGPVVYLWGPKDFLKAFKLAGGTFQTTPATQSTIQNSTGFSNSAPMSISANNNLVGGGILWAAASFAGLATGPSVPGILRAFDATNLGTELWDSKQDAARDDVGLYAKFNPPTVANGKVYLGTFSGQLQVYGLNPPAAGGISFVQAASATPQTTASVSVPFSSAQGGGDLNVVVVSWNDTTSTIQSVTDSLGNTYSLAVGPTAGTGKQQSVYYAQNILSGSNTVTVIFNQGATSPDVRALEYSGIDTVAPLDITIGASGNNSTADSGPATLTNANDLIIGANIVGAKNIVAGATYTSRLLTGTNQNIVEDRVVNLAGSYNAWSPMVSAAPWVTQMVAFKAGGATSPTAPAIGGISPSSGTASGGTVVTITGANFAAGATVNFGGLLATNVVVVNGTSITAVTPAHAAGAVTVTVTNANGESGSLAGGYAYVAGAGGTISFVQVNAATPQAPTASVSVTYLAPETASDLNIVAVGWNDTTSTVSSVTDSRGNTYTLAVGPTVGTGLTQSIYYANNIAAGSNTVTVSFNQPAAFADVRILEYGGLDTSNPLDVTAGAASNGTTASSGAATTTAANELVFGAGMTATVFTAAGAGFTSRIFTTPNTDIAEDQAVSMTGSYSATATGGPGNWVMQMATFVMASAPTPTVTSVSPNNGPVDGSTDVTVNGTNFVAGATVLFGSNAATNVTVLNSRVISATTPPAAAGAVTVTVTNSTGRSGALPNAYTYAATTGNQNLGLGVAAGDSNSATVAAGQTASYTLSIGGTGVSGTASLSCSGAPMGAKCTVPASQAVSAATAASFTVSVTTTSRTIGALNPHDAVPMPWLWTVAAMGIVIWPGMSLSISKRTMRRCLLLASLTLLLFITSCGGGSSSTGGGGSGPQPNPNGTPAGTYTLTVTATSGSASQSSPLTLIVQ